MKGFNDLPPENPTRGDLFKFSQRYAVMQEEDEKKRKLTTIIGKTDTEIFIEAIDEYLAKKEAKQREVVIEAKKKKKQK